MGRARKERKHQFRMAEYQWSKDLEMWNKQNEYNTPQNQVKRIQDAGLNKNMMYGQGTVANTSQQTPKYQAPTVKYRGIEPSDVQGVLGSFQDVQLKTAQTNNLRAQTEITNQRSMNEEIRNLILATDAKAKGFDLESAKKLLPYQMDAQKRAADEGAQKLENMRKDGSLKDQVIKQAELDVIFKKHRNRLSKMGVYQSDNKLMRWMAIGAQKAGVSFEKVMEWVKNNKGSINIKKLQKQ
jgi:hypothetical protein